MLKKEKYDLEAHDQRFGSEELCNQFLIDRIYNGKPTCNKCGNCNGNYKLRTRKKFTCPKCKKQFSITTGTIFEKSKVPLKKWFKAIYLLNVDKKGISSILLSKYIGVQQKTAWLMLQKLRDAMKLENESVLSGVVHADELHLLPVQFQDRRLQALNTLHELEQDKIHGPSKGALEKQKKKEKEEAIANGTFVETRGSKKGVTKEMRAKIKEEREQNPINPKLSVRTPFEKGTIVFGMVERSGRIVLKKLGPDSRFISKDNIVPLLIKHVHPSSILMTDGSTMYNETHELFVQHFVAPRGKKLVSPEGINSNAIENAWKHLRKVIRGTYISVAYHHMDGYLNEYVFRWNKRDKSQRELFEEFIPMSAQKKITKKEIRSRSKAA